MPDSFGFSKSWSCYSDTRNADNKDVRRINGAWYCHSSRNFRLHWTTQIFVEPCNQSNVQKTWGGSTQIENNVVRAAAKDSEQNALQRNAPAIQTVSQKKKHVTIVNEAIADKSSSHKDRMQQQDPWDYTWDSLNGSAYPAGISNESRRLVKTDFVDWSNHRSIWF